MMLDLWEEKLSVAASGRLGLPTAAIVSDLVTAATGFGGIAGVCCLFFS